jgi:transcriptional regulator with XRE-family HTH domain
MQQGLSAKGSVRNVGSTNETLAALISTLLITDGRSIEQVATAAGFHPSALRRWAAGQFRPSVETLTALLQTLGADRNTAAEAFSRINEPRAKEAVRQALLSFPGADVAANAAWWEWMPAVGDLWRALRQRRGLTAAEVARTLGVTRSTVTRWEQSETAPGEDRRERLLSLLGALPEDRMALTDPSLLLARPWRAAGVSLEEWDRRVEVLGERLLAGGAFAGDLHLFVLESHLWEIALRAPAALILLGRAYEWHCIWLAQKGREPEMGVFADRAISLLAPAQGKSFRGVWPHARMHWARYLNATGQRRKAVRCLEGTLMYVPGMQHRLLRSQILREMATYGCALHPRQAFVWVEDSERLAVDAGSEVYVRGSRLVKARLHLAHGEPEAALPLLPDLGNEMGIAAVRLRLLWAKALLAAGDRSAAHTHLNRFYELVRRYDYSHLLPEGDALAQFL